MSEAGSTTTRDAVRSDNPDSHESPWLYLMLALLGTAGFFYVNLAAAIVDGLVGTLGFSHAQAGEIMSANIYGASLGGLIAVFVVRRLPWRPVFVGLLCLMVVMELVSMFVHSYAMLLPLRALNGLVGGLSVGIALALLARTRFPDRAFGALLAFQFAFGGLGSWLLPRLVEEHGTWLLFACMATMDIAAILVALFVRIGNTARVEQRAATVLARKRVIALTSATLLALFLFQAANMGLFAFIIPLGESGDLSLSFISQTVGWTTWIGALGAVAVIVFGTQLGRAGPLLLAMVVTLIGTSLLYWSADKLLFFTANASTAITWSFVVPYLFGIVSVLDRSGRLATLAGFISGLGLASGPLFAGWVAQPDTFVPMISTALMLMLVATVAMVAAAWRVDKIDPTSHLTAA